MEDQPVPKEVIQGVLREYLEMNKCAIAWTLLVEYIAQNSFEVITAEALRVKIEEFSAQAAEKVKGFAKIIDSQEG